MHPRPHTCSKREWGAATELHQPLSFSFIMGFHCVVLAGLELSMPWSHRHLLASASHSRAAATARDQSAGVSSAHLESTWSSALELSPPRATATERSKAHEAGAYREAEAVGLLKCILFFFKLNFYCFNYLYVSGYMHMNVSTPEFQC